MNLINVAKYGALGAGSMALAAAAVAKNPKTRQGEHAINNFASGVGLAYTAALPFMTKAIVKANPKMTVKAANYTGKAIEKATEFVTKNAPKVIEKVKANKVGAKALDYIGKAAKKAVEFVKGNKTLANIAKKGVEALEKFAKSPTTKKGKYALVAAGLSLLALGAVKILQKHAKRSGAIDQKYDSLRVEYEQMLGSKKPIMDGKTGEPITFEQYCVAAQTYLK